MKRYLLPLTALLLVGCSAKMDDVAGTTLQPMPTSEIINETIPVTDVVFTSEQISFLDDVYFFYGAVPPMSDDEIIQIGELWCQLMTDGMTADDVISRINEGSSDNDDAKLHYSIVMSGGENLCKDQFAKAESIALRYLTP